MKSSRDRRSAIRPDKPSLTRPASARMTASNSPSSGDGLQVRPDAFELGTSEKAASPDSATALQFSQMIIIPADQHVGRRSSLGYTSDCELGVSVEYRHVFQAVHSDVDLSF